MFLHIYGSVSDNLLYCICPGSVFGFVSLHTDQDPTFINYNTNPDPRIQIRIHITSINTYFILKNPSRKYPSSATEWEQKICLPDIVLQQQQQEFSSLHMIKQFFTA